MRVRTPDGSPDRRRRSHPVGAIIVAPLWAPAVQPRNTPADLRRRRRRLHGGTAARLGVRRTASWQHWLPGRSCPSHRESGPLDREQATQRRSDHRRQAHRGATRLADLPAAWRTLSSSDTSVRRNRIRCSRPARRAVGSMVGRGANLNVAVAGSLVLYRLAGLLPGSPVGVSLRAAASRNAATGSTSSGAQHNNVDPGDRVRGAEGSGSGPVLAVATRWSSQRVLAGLPSAGGPMCPGCDLPSRGPHRRTSPPPARNVPAKRTSARPLLGCADGPSGHVSHRPAGCTGRRGPT